VGIILDDLLLKISGGIKESNLGVRFKGVWYRVWDSVFNLVNPKLGVTPIGLG
jgi:hypothetical protein